MTEEMTRRMRGQLVEAGRQRRCADIKILLIPKARVGRDKDFEAVLFSGVQQLTVLQRRPAALVSR